MYKKQYLTETFNKVTEFFGIRARLVETRFLGAEEFVFFVDKQTSKQDCQKIAQALSNELGIRAEVKPQDNRQKAQSIGGCGPCGRELCCASWLKNPPSPTPESLKGKSFSDASDYLGMCGELRCCLVFMDDDFKLPCQTPACPKRGGGEKEDGSEKTKPAPQKTKRKKKMKVVRKLTLKKRR